MCCFLNLYDLSTFIYLSNVMIRLLKDPACLKHETVKYLFSFYGLSIQILCSNTGNIFIQSFLWYLVSKCFSFNRAAFSPGFLGKWSLCNRFVRVHVRLCPLPVIFEPLGQNQAKLDKKIKISDDHIPVYFVKRGTEEERGCS